MARWFMYAALLIAACFVGGWALVVLSGHGGGSGGGSRPVWLVGGLMVYASVLCTPIYLVTGVVALAVERVVARHRPPR